MDVELTKAEWTRYSRHLLLPEVADIQSGQLEPDKADETQRRMVPESAGLKLDFSP